MMCEVWKYMCWQAGHPIIAIGPETSTEDMYMFRREDYFIIDCYQDVKWVSMRITKNCGNPSFYSPVTHVHTMYLL